MDKDNDKGDGKGGGFVDEVLRRGDQINAMHAHGGLGLAKTIGGRRVGGPHYDHLDGHRRGQLFRH